MLAVGYPTSVPELLQEIDIARLRPEITSWEGHLEGSSFGAREEVEKAVIDHMGTARGVEWERWNHIVVTFGRSELHQVVSSKLDYLITEALEEQGHGDSVVCVGSACTFSPPRLSQNAGQLTNSTPAFPSLSKC